MPKARISYAVALPLAAVLLCAPVQADELSRLTALVKQVRATPALNKERDAGPDLTPVKTALREWVETKLPAPTKPGRQKGSVETPDKWSLGKLADQLNDELDKAGLTCGDYTSATYRCQGADEYFETHRGAVGPVSLSTFDSGGTQYLALITRVGVLCGDDESFYLYRPEGSGWKLALASEQNDYREGTYAPQSLTQITVSDESSSADADRQEPLVATLGYGFWCSSTWSSLYTRLWRLVRDRSVARPLVNQANSMWWGNEDFGSASLNASGLLVEYTAASMDTGVHSRKHVLNFRVDPGDTITRIDPVALRPTDFVDEWLSMDWAQASQWVRKPAPLAPLQKAHARGPAEFDDTGKRCRNDDSLWQVSLVDGRHFKVRWTPPYVFRLVALSYRPFPGCDLADPKAETAEHSLFHDTGWRPGS